jgi:quercetin dioxygenase-like cupin family protein
MAILLMLDDGGTMTDLERANIDEPVESRPFMADKGRMDLVLLDGVLVGRGTFEPGWRWSEHVKPIAGTDSCQAAHMGYCISGRMRVRMDDGQEAEVGPGDFMLAAPGHDAWIVGDEACVIIDWQGVKDYAKRA